MDLDAALKQLSDRKIARRAEAIRAIALVGGLSELQRMTDVILADKSPSVRLYAAAAASSIAMRGRGAAGQTRWSAEVTKQVETWLRPVDIVLTPSALLIYSAFPTPKILDRVSRLVRHPQSIVRSAAVMAFRRMTLSAAADSDQVSPREWIADALQNRKTPTDATLDLVSLVGEVGWTELLPIARRAAANIEDSTLPTAEERCRARAMAATWNGKWASFGLDVFEEGPTRETTLLTLNGVTKSYRMVFAPQVGRSTDIRCAVQKGGNTFWKLTDADQTRVKKGPAKKK